MRETLDKKVDSWHKICHATGLDGQWKDLKQRVASIGGDLTIFVNLFKMFDQDQQPLYNMLGEAPSDPIKLKQYLELTTFASTPNAKITNAALRKFSREFKKLIDIFESFE
jgi:hypothetical protein